MCRFSKILGWFIIFFGRFSLSIVSISSLASSGRFRRRHYRHSFSNGSASPWKNCRVTLWLNQPFPYTKNVVFFQTSTWRFSKWRIGHFFQRSVKQTGRVMVARARRRNPLHGGSGAPRAPLALRRTRVCACCSHVSSLASVHASTESERKRIHSVISWSPPAARPSSFRRNVTSQHPVRSAKTPFRGRIRPVGEAADAKCPRTCILPKVLERANKMED